MQDSKTISVKIFSSLMTRPVHNRDLSNATYPNSGGSGPHQVQLPFVPTVDFQLVTHQNVKWAERVEGG